MEETTFAADPMRLMIAAAVGIVVLLVLIIKFKLHPVLSMMISAIIIGAGAGMPLTMISFRHSLRSAIPKPHFRT